MVAPRPPSSTNTATARSPCVATIHACVLGGLSFPNSAVPVFAPTGVPGGTSARNPACPEVTTARIMSESAAASSLVIGLVDAGDTGAALTEADDGDAPPLSVGRGTGAGGVLGGVSVRSAIGVQHELRRNGSAVGDGSSHDRGRERGGKEHLALANHGSGVLGTFGSARNRTQERVSAKLGSFNRYAEGLGCGFELVLADGITGVDEGSVAGVCERVTQATEPRELSGG